MFYTQRFQRCHCPFLVGHCCLVIAPINILLKSGSSRSVLSTLSDSQIASGEINIESNKQYKHKVEWHNIWINGSLGCRKVLKLWNIGITDLTNMAYSLLTGCLNAFTNLFFLLGFSSGPFSVGSSSKSKLYRKYDRKESYCINILSKHFRKFNHLVETWFITFLTSLLLRLMNCFFVLHSCKLVVYVKNQILRICRKFFGYLSQHTNVLNDKGNQHKKSEGGCYIVQS